MRVTLPAICFYLLFSIAGPAGWGAPLAPPPNDECPGAEVIPSSGPFPYLTAVTPDITEATKTNDPPRPSCQGDTSRSIWYTFTPSVTAEYTIATCSGLGTATTVDDTVMQVYTNDNASCDGVPGRVSDGCDDDGCSAEIEQSVVRNLELLAGEIYYFVIWKVGPEPPSVGNTAVQLLIEQNVPPANDSCSGAIPLVLDTPFEGSKNAGANDYQLTDQSCFTGGGQIPSSATGRDTVHSFTAPATDEYSFRARNLDNGGDLVVYTASSCPDAPPTQNVGTCILGANRNTNFVAYGSSEEVFCQSMAASEQVYVFVDESGGGSSGGAYSIEVNRCPAEVEPNDTPALASAPVCGVEGSIAPGGDADFYALGSRPADFRVFAMVDGVAANSTNLDLRVTTTTDTLEYDNDNNDLPFGISSPNVSGTPLTGVDSYLRVDQLTPTSSTEPYRLYSVVQAGIEAAARESEPNDSLAQANSAINDYFLGDLADSSDLDYFSFGAAAGDLVLLGLDGDPLRDATPIEGELALLDSNGALLVAVDDPSYAASTDPGTGSLTAQTPIHPGEAIAWRILATGTYYARVSGAWEGDYLLSIVRNCVVAEADVFLSNSDAPDPVESGQVLSYTIDVGNDGPDVAGPVRVFDPTPAGTTFLALSAPTGWSCSTPPVGSGGIVDCTIPTLAVAGAATITIDVLVDFCVGDGTLLSNTATVAGGVPDPDVSDNSATVSTTVTDPGSCDDGLFCTVGESCNAGVCGGGLPRDCDDANECTEDSCDEAAGTCVNDDAPLEGGPCDDNDPTTCSDTCTTGSCVGTPVPEPAPVGDSVRMTITGTLATVSWNDLPGPYNAYKGTIDPGPYDQGCMNLIAPIVGASITDDVTPAPKDTVYYLVTRVDQCRESTPGTDWTGATRPNDFPCDH